MNLPFASLVDCQQDPARKRLITVLSALLVVQLGLAGALKFFEARYQPVEATSPMLSWDISAATKVVLEEAAAEGKPHTKLVLEKVGSSWKLPELHGFPASSASVEQLFATLKELKKGFPVSTTPESAERFKVSASNFQRAISFFAGSGKLGVLYLGSSPAFRSMYARTEGSNDIFIVPVTDYQVSARPTEWIDRMVADLKPKEITAVDLEKFKVTKKKDGWLLSAGGKEQVLHDSIVQKVLEAVSHLSISEVLGTTEDPLYNLDKPVLSCTVTLSGGKVRTYKFGRPKDKNYYVLKLSDANWYMQVDDWAVERIKEITADSLLKAEAARLSARPAQDSSRPSQDPSRKAR